jgi:hypothetical protein
MLKPALLSTVTEAGMRFVSAPLWTLIGLGAQPRLPRGRLWLPRLPLGLFAWLALALLGLAMWFAALPLWPGLLKAFMRRPSLSLGMCIGVFGFWLLWHGVLRHLAWWRSLATLEHEIAHLLAAWTVGGRLLSLNVLASGEGSVRWEGARGQWWVALAPYWLPTPLILGLVFLGRPATAHTMMGSWIQASCWGALLACHCIQTWQETRAQQPDLQDVGLAYATAFLAAAHILLATAMMNYLSR